MSRYKAVLFDFDGTVVDSNQIIIDSWQNVAKNMLGHEMSLDLVFSTFGRPLEDGYKVVAKATGIAPTEENFAKMHKLYTGYQADNIKAPFPAFPGMIELVKKLHKDGIKLGVVTSRREVSLTNGLTSHDIYDCFDFLVCMETTTIHKPDPYPATLCCEKLGVKPKDAVMVGDSVYDIACGNNAGCDSIFVNWSMSFTKKDVDAYSPATYYVDTAEEIYDIVK